ncbi:MULTISPECIES: peptidoglycan D,D-transpeptidase FtsI family protein [unclassified Acinetobacter]|uniref:peptidoglycan D,D-transpeptidase FtsI family protein n=1 Tax=unclassified Acinetobacter TaxID=196816 RepID=UPI0035BB8F88
MTVKKNKRFLSQKKSSAAVAEKPSIDKDLWRFRLLWGATAFAFCLLTGRALWIQVINQDFFQSKVEDNIVKDETLRAMRGTITDRNGVPLAISTPVMTVMLDPKEYYSAKDQMENVLDQLKKGNKDGHFNHILNQFPNGKIDDDKLVEAQQFLNKNLPEKSRLRLLMPNRELDLNLLAKAVEADPVKLKQDVYARRNTRYLLLKKQVPPDQVQALLDKRFQGLTTEKEYKRYYPQAQPNAQIVGLANSAGKGIEGLELQWNEKLTGQDGLQRIIRDRRGNQLKIDQVVNPRKDGQTLALSLDSRLQYVMYRELAAAGVENKARSATAIAVDIKTGEILAMNSWPSYNPNDPSSFGNKDAMRNRVAIDSFEPGSTMKPFTIMLGLKNGKFSTNSYVNTSPGTMRIAGHNIHDTHNYGNLSLGGIIIKSSNVGAAKVALSMPYADLPNFYKKIGFGKTTAVGFPGESAGLILPPSRWNISEVATMSYGYGLNVTALQLVQAYAMIANKGREMPLSLYKVDTPPQGEQIVSEKIATDVLKMLEGVTQPGGTATQATIPGYRVGGKTGTAHKVRTDGKGYSNSEYRALFAGVAPISDPRLALVVVVENPQGKYYGGLVAAPVFAKIMQESLRLLNVPLDRALDMPKESDTP